MGLLNFLLSQDKMGHPLTIYYKGNQAHPSIFGAFITISILILVGIQLIQKTMELYEMSDPIV